MGRKADNSDRQTVKLPFLGKPIELYRPTDGQATAIYLASKKDGDAAVDVFFRVVEALVVKPADWTTLENLMISGAARVKDFSELFKNLNSYDWPDVPADGE